MQHFRSVQYGILFSLLTLVYGFGLGGVFGVAEDRIKGYLKAEAQQVASVAYGNDPVKMKKVTDKAWVYFKRAHLHANGLGTSSLVLILLLSYLPAAPVVQRVISLALGVGALGYSSFWMFAGMRAPGLGSTGAAKESLEWLAVSSSALCILGLCAVLVIFVRRLLAQKD